MTADEGRSTSLADEAYLTLRERIVTCHLAPGERITEKQVAADLGFGLTPVRRALLRLTGDGLVRTLPRRGYQVTPLSIASVNELFQVWRIIGPAIGELAVSNMTAEERTELATREKAKARAAMQAGGGTALIDASAELWTVLAERTGNGRLMDMYVRLLGDLRRVFLLLVQNPAALEVTRFGDEESWTFVQDLATVREKIERAIDQAHQAVLKILLSWRTRSPAPTRWPASPPARTSRSPPT
ncbi:GntR family transcriptional regulator, partial [Streptomyces sp. NPDC057621]|uniref:GntR family transcriptional regulator n=1 Tax=Streptomyces sp. NPDC057621 TaxID=3346186 RepID=UPI00368CA689